MKKRLLVVVDFQNDFVLEPRDNIKGSGGALPIHGAESLIYAVNSIIACSHMHTYNYKDILFTFDSHDLSTYIGSLENVGDSKKGIPGFPPHCITHSPGWRLACDHYLISSQVRKYMLKKNVFDMWAENDTTIGPLYSDDISRFQQRDEFFANKLSEYESVDICGVAADYCVNWAVHGFAQRGCTVRVLTKFMKGIHLTGEECFEQYWSKYPNVSIFN